MIGVVVLLGLCVVAAALLAGPVRRIEDEHTLTGLFGEPPREALIHRWTSRVIDTAERYERLDAFRRRLGQRAFTGTPLRIEKGVRGWCAWHFADGEVWQVRHVERPPRTVARLIVEGAADDGTPVLAVRTYVPGSHGILLPVSDARPPKA